MSRMTKRILLWGSVAMAILLLAPFLGAYLEMALLGSGRIEDAMRWVGIHEAAMRVRDWVAL